MLEIILIVLTTVSCIFIYYFGAGFTSVLLEEEIERYYESQRGVRFEDKTSKQTVMLLSCFFWYIILPTILGLKLGAKVLKSARETFFTPE